RHVVRHEQHGAAAATDRTHLLRTLLLKRLIAHRQHLIDDEDFRLQVGGNGEREPHIHTGGVALHGRVEELLDAGEGDDLVELPRDLAASHAEDAAVQVNV